MTVQEILFWLKGVKRQGAGWIALCPAHADRTPSLKVDNGSDGKALLHCFAGCSYESIQAAIGTVGDAESLWSEVPSRRTSALGSELLNVAPNSVGRQRQLSPPVLKPDRERLETIYIYEDEFGRFLFQVVRLQERLSDGSTKKKFLQRRRPRVNEHPSVDGWVYKLDGVPRVLYNLRELGQAPMVWVVEGEKDVETLRGLGQTATCNPGGAGKWRPDYNEALRGKTVAILPDNDEAGLRHAEEVATSLYGTANEVLVIQLPGLPPKGDVTDFVVQGGTGDDLIDLVQRAEPWEPKIRTATKGLVFTPVSSLVSEPEEPISYIWDQTLPTGGFSIMSAKPKVGKSTIARGLCDAVVKGASFLGRPTTPVPILYLCLEEKRSEVSKTFRRMGASSDRILVHTGATPENVLILLEEAIGEHSAGLVVIDPLSRVLRVADYNAYGMMATGLESFIDLARRTGCHIMALHHDSKLGREGGDALLGSTALFGAVDCHIQLMIRDGPRVISSTQRYGEDIPPTVIQLDKETESIVSAGSLKEIRIAKAREAILAALESGESLTQLEIKSRISDFTGGQLSAGLRELVDDKVVQRSATGKRGDPYKYCKSG